MRVALLSDIHANEIALRAVLADLQRQSVDRIVCLGDVATLGPQPHAVLEILSERNCACVMGNHDEFLLDRALARQYSDGSVIGAAVDWCRDALSEDELDYIYTFESTIDISLEHGATLLAYHGSPRSHLENLLATTSADELDLMLAGHSATVLAGGHTHVQMLRQHRGALVVNPGSVGLPFKEFVAGRAPMVLAHAEYALVEASRAGVEVSLKRVHLERDALRDAAAASRTPFRDVLVAQYL